mmetsp:Transcript_4543/g.8512  ORF Transcript_4543/g.8512 Transcript_4543/m.8512 type:complete len:404 (+) Transcript_4543:306-1517(+)
MSQIRPCVRSASFATPRQACSSSCSNVQPALVMGKSARALRRVGQHACFRHVCAAQAQALEVSALTMNAPLTLETLPAMSISEITAPVADDMATMNQNLLNVVGERHPMLKAAAEQIFGAGGKKLRPMLIFLVSHATAELGGLKELTPQHRQLAEITEMIHTASLVHDDVLDECDLRRGKATVNSKYGTRMAVLAGDYLFAQSSWFLANLDDLEVIKLISQVIADFANGEISQAASLFDCDVTLETYMEKSFYKTASLIAASCRSAAVFSGMPEEVKEDMFNYGKHLGLAFQVVDDILDFTQTEEQLGKPRGQDMASGNLTCPIIFTMQKNPELRDILESEFQEDDSLETALDMVMKSGGIEMAMDLAREEGQLALDSLKRLPDGEMKDSLSAMVGYVLERIY